MRIEPTLDKGRLQGLLRDRYGLDVARLTFVPYGTDSWCYVAECRDRSRAFVKLLRRPPGADITASEMALLAALATRLVPVPRPIARRDGSFPSTLDGHVVQVFEYLDGHNLEDERAWPDDLYARVAEIVAAVHASTTAVRHLVERVEGYELPFVGPLAETVAVIEAGGSLAAGDDPTLARLRELVVPRARELRVAVGRLEELRDLTRERDADEVLCHTDIWGSNLLLSDDRTLHLLDWNGALLGPPEHDLFMFAGTVFFPAGRFAWFLERYETSFRRVRLDARTFGFYFYRRNLEDLASFVASIAEGRVEALDPSEMLTVVERLLASLPHLEDRIEHVTNVLDKVHRS